ncbi:hypothetical protein [Mameliella sediminis]|uniref:hypothetical protein n=1 Tax=Mameliella sediminis TaxID=2836866 RepID=UPI001C478832|nr:hypothetical protein [Mameliella sediminis]MBY6113332.1 hypothetical protein [Antarctobacter heliothermus]MBY6143320.1 hypothetical protein [Mameliella alba]MBV7394617.1 hypothetical protein [Mameliella sediminis]MBY6164007.1 hypothetical protein [Mameliella alba]MBY6172479.1 hypothetical protein [Mameliella alba]
MKLTLTAAATAIALSATSALAWGDMYMGDATNDPNSNFLIHEYKAPNFCPAGLQPVLAGGVVCCGTPNAGVYYNHSGSGHRSYAPQIVPGEKGVVYR